MNGDTGRIGVMHLHAKACQQPTEAERESYGVDCLSESLGTNPDLRLISRPVQEYISVVLSHHICGNLLEQP